MVIKNCGTGDNHPFQLDAQYQLGGTGADGKSLTQVDALNGQVWNVIGSATGDQLELDKNPGTANEFIEIRNENAKGSIVGELYNNGLLIAKTDPIDPGQNGTFGFRQAIYIGAMDSMEEGALLDSAALDQLQSQVGLMGVSAADIIMTGGGVGPNATQYQFELVPIT
jgi:hypothetical protein